MRAAFLRLLFVAGACVSSTFGQTPAGTLDLEALARTGESTWLTWDALPDVPDELGLAGAFVGVHDDVLIVAGGANFPVPEGAAGLWDAATTKVYSDAIHVLLRDGDEYTWKTVEAKLPRPIAYGASVSTHLGVYCVGGQDNDQAYADTFFLAWDAASQNVLVQESEPLPEASTAGQAVWMNDAVWVWTGQSGTGADSASSHLWQRVLEGESDWTAQPDLPAHARTMAQLVVQHDGYDKALYLIGGRYEDANDAASQAAPLGLHFLRETWQFKPDRLEGEPWQRKADAPVPLAAGNALPTGQSHVFVLGYATGESIAAACAANGGTPDWANFDHPGFPRTALAYHTITDTWTEAGALPLNQVTTPAVRWGEDMLVISGEAAPKVRSRVVWRYSVNSRARNFTGFDYAVVVLYLLCMIGVGVWFAFRNKSTDDFFRGGKHIPWWAAGCSIYATMLSSLTFIGLPGKTFAQDWAYFSGALMIVAVSPIAVYGALPFFRKIDATSAYEYLEKRFNRTVRLFGSACFTVFHLFRMAIVMSLTALALAICTPMDPVQSVLLMGVLSIAYCAMGGIEAVVWTDTIQTVVLLGGALIALLFMLQGAGEAPLDVAFANDKTRWLTWNWDVTSTHAAVWVMVIGGLFQNVSSYTADQAVVQRYMTTPDKRLAARAIWTNAALVIPGALVFYALGTGLYLFYRTNPGALDPTITTDQILPYYIGTQLPAGLAGLIIAGVFAAAQSTVSTSMNSISTTTVTDFLRPFNACASDKGYLRAARAITVVAGIIGTALGLFFIDPSFRSLLDEFLKVVGMFMGLLGGLFLLGVLTRRTTGLGAMIGAVVGVSVMISLWKFTAVHAAIYPAFGVLSCFLVGWLVSWVLPRERSVRGLTIYTINEPLGSED